MGTVPFLIVGSVNIPQSKAIERFVARRLGLFGIDPFEEALVDSICELIRDLEQALLADESRCLMQIINVFTASLTAPFYRFLAVDLPDALIVINRFISRACGGFCVGCSLSLADIKVFQFLNPSIFLQQYGAWHAQLPSLLAQYPRVASLITKVGAVHGIQAWIKKMH